VLAPGLRVGWLVTTEELLETPELLKQPIDLHTGAFCQHVATEYLRTGVIDDQLDDIVEVSAAKRDLALERLAETMPPYVDWTRPDGGMCLWMTLPERFDTERLLRAAVDNGVAYIPGHALCATEPRRNTLRINYTYADDEAFVEGIDRLAAIIRERDIGGARSGHRPAGLQLRVCQ